MKISNLILTFILVLTSAPFLFSQSNSVRVVTIDNDDESINIRYENDELIELEIDGVKIPKSKYNKYEKLLEKYSNDTPIPPSTDTERKEEIVDEEKNMGAILHEELRSYLVDINAMNSDKYKFKLTADYIKVNGKKLKSDILNECLGIFEQTVGHELNRDSHFKVKISSSSSSISLSINDY